jgi:hypothetical protein
MATTTDGLQWLMTRSEFQLRERFGLLEKGLGRVWVIHDWKNANPVIGKRFSEIEFVICMAMVAQKWTIHLKSGWTKEKVWDILDASVQYTTIRPSSNIPLVFKKR